MTARAVLAGEDSARGHHVGLPLRESRNAGRERDGDARERRCRDAIVPGPCHSPDPPVPVRAIVNRNPEIRPLNRGGTTLTGCNAPNRSVADRSRTRMADPWLTG